MAVTQAGNNPVVSIRINDGEDLFLSVNHFKWTSFINDGYTIFARVLDPNLGLIEQFTNQELLKDGRVKPLKVEFQLFYQVGITDQKTRTDKRIAYVTNFDSKIMPGSQTAAYMEFVAIDPPTWYLNRGRGDGSVYKGSVSDVITKVINEYSVGEITPIISRTLDNKVNNWYMMRQDPKTFLMTLLDWSCSLASNETNWVVASVDDTIIIKEQAELETSDLGEYACNTEYSGSQNIVQWEREDNNYLSNIQTRLMTGGISAVSGLYCSIDNPITKDLVVVDDDNTSNKKNVDIQRDQGYTRPTDTQNGLTFVRAVPEDSAGAVGPQYQNYIDGRARALYIGSLDTLQRMKITVAGSTLVDNSSQLGASTVMLKWQQGNDGVFSHQGKWLVYGFEHVFTRDKQWYTHIYINRKDFNAKANKVN